MLIQWINVSMRINYLNLMLIELILHIVNLVHMLLEVDGLGNFLLTDMALTLRISSQILTLVLTLIKVLVSCFFLKVLLSGTVLLHFIVHDIYLLIFFFARLVKVLGTSYRLTPLCVRTEIVQICIRASLNHFPEAAIANQTRIRFDIL